MKCFSCQNESLPDFPYCRECNNERLPAQRTTHSIESMQQQIRKMADEARGKKVYEHKYRPTLADTVMETML